MLTYTKVFCMLVIAGLCGINVGFLCHLCHKTINKLEKYAEKNGYIVKTFTKELIACTYTIVIGAVIVLSFIYVSYIFTNY